MRRVENVVFILFFLFLVFSCMQDSGVESEIPPGQLLWFSERSVPFIDGKTGSMITQTGVYDEYIIYDDDVDTIQWKYPALIILTPNHSGSGHVFVWRLPKVIDKYKYEEIVVDWHSWVFEPESLMTYFPQFQINTDENTDPLAPDSIGFVAVCRRPTDIHSYLPSPEEGWYNYKTIFKYPEFDELDDRIYLTLIRPKNFVVIFGVIVKGIPL